MSGLCPKCNKRPRRRPGQSCTPCDVAANKQRRHEISAGRQLKHRVEAAETESNTKFKRPLKSERYIITSAQNATPEHAPFLETLKVAAKFMDAELVVIPLRYKNPTSVWSDKQSHDEWWSTPLKPYLYNQRKKLNPNLVLVGDIKIQPTASAPLSGFESLTGAESCIIGHPRMQLRSVPVPSGRYPKILSTTGSCTIANYTDSKAGALGKFNQRLGAIVVETKGKWFTLRQVEGNWSDGSFTDKNWHYTSEGVRPAERALGVVLGDVHERFIDKSVQHVTFGPGGIIDTLDPENIVVHDVLDGYTVNPHHHGNPFIAQAKLRGQLSAVQSEVEHAVEFLKRCSKGRKVVVVASNHDDFLSRWVMSHDWRSNPTNASFYLETAKAMLDSVRMTEHGAEYADPFVYWVQRLKGDADIKCLGIDESFKLGDIECGLHGHRGPNGARGSLKNLSRLGAKVISAHAHTPGIEEGNYQVGTSTPRRLEYTHGPSSWLNTHCVVYATGARALVSIVDGRWHLPTKAKRR